MSACPLLIQIDAFGTKVKDVQVLTDMGVIVNYNPIEEEYIINPKLKSY